MSLFEALLGFGPASGESLSCQNGGIWDRAMATCFTVPEASWDADEEKFK